MVTCCCVFVTDDQNYSKKYFHLVSANMTSEFDVTDLRLIWLINGAVWPQIDPDIDQDQKKNPERKKLKLKEVYLTKLLSTKARKLTVNLHPDLSNQPLSTCHCALING